MKKTFAFAISALFCAILQIQAADISLLSAYGNHMVFQREKPIRIVGMTEPNQTVKGTLATSAGTAKSDADGKFVLELPALKAGGPYTLTLNCDGTETKLEDILIGELWICSGQSNMEFPVWQTSGSFQLKNGKQIASQIANPNIRICRAKQKVSPMVEEENANTTSWSPATQDALRDFSAVGYFFGCKLQKDLQIPIGLIDSSWGGTHIHPWIPEKTLLAADDLEYGKQLSDAKAAAEKNKDIHIEDTPEYKTFMEWRTKLFNYNEAAADARQNWAKLDHDDSSWESSEKIPESTPIAFFWLRGYFELHQADFDKLDLSKTKLNLGVVDDIDMTYINGVEIGSTGPERDSPWTYHRLYQLPENASFLHAGKNVLAIRVGNTGGTGGYAESGNLPCLTDGKHTVPLRISGYKWKLESAIDKTWMNRKPSLPALSGVKGSGSNTFPSTLYNGMIAPFTCLNIRGAIWYQGCADTSDSSAIYARKQQLLIRGWREAFRTPDMPFIITELSAYEPVRNGRLADNYRDNIQPDVNLEGYPAIREAQEYVGRTESNCGFAVTIDVGDHSDIHPQQKQPVGERLASEAERLVYSAGKQVPRSPVFESMEVKDGKAIISFRFAEKGLKAATGSPDNIREFAVAGADGKYYWADAKIEGNKVIVSSEHVAIPKTVRYAWSNYPGKVNLISADGYPVSPFRTDTPLK